MNSLSDMSGKGVQRGLQTMKVKVGLLLEIKHLAKEIITPTVRYNEDELEMKKEAIWNSKQDAEMILELLGGPESGDDEIIIR